MVVNDIPKTRTFFEALGFSFNPQFSDENAVCLVISDTIFAMLMTEESMKRFTKKRIINPREEMECINAIQLESRSAVDEMKEKALKAGATIYRDPEDYGWMYLQSIEDLDGHVWEFCFIDEKAIPKN